MLFNNVYFIVLIKDIKKSLFILELIFDQFYSLNFNVRQLMDI